jgi:cobalamin-dependent methionine synthase I
MDSVEDEIRAELASGESLAPRYSPGYGTFPLSAQRELLALLDAPRTVGVSLTYSFAGVEPVSSMNSSLPRTVS